MTGYLIAAALFALAILVLLLINGPDLDGVDFLAVSLAAAGVIVLALTSAGGVQG